MVPPVLATLDDEKEPMSVHYFPVRDEFDSDSEVECIVLPSSLPLVPLRRDHSTDGGIMKAARRRHDHSSSIESRDDV